MSSADVLSRHAGVSRKAPVVMAVITLLAAALFIGAWRAGVTGFRFSEATDLVVLPTVRVPSRQTTVVVVLVMLVLSVVSAWRVRGGRRTPGWVIAAFAFAFLVALLVWAAAGATIAVTGLLAGTLALSVPLIFGAMGGVLSERAGVINVAIEGQLLAGACVSAVIASVTGSALAGLVAATVAGVLVSSVLGLFSIRYFVDQIIVGIVVNVLVVGLTGFFYSRKLAPNDEMFNSPPRLPKLPVPVLGDIPLLGPVLFRETVIVYAMYAVVVLVWLRLYKTRAGLRTRAIGEHPQAADTVGIDVRAARFRAVAMAGAVAGFGGAYLTLGSVGGFGKDMTAGAGFIALAAVILGRWDPVRATMAALLFGFASNLQNVLGIVGSPIPSEFMLMLPYVVTVLAVAGFVGRIRPPAANGTAYGGPQ